MYTQRPFSFFYYDDYWGLRNNPPPSPPVTILRRPEIKINFVSDLNNRAVPYSSPNFSGFFSPPESPPNVFFSPPKSINPPESPPYSPPDSPRNNFNGFFNFTDSKDCELEKTPSRSHHRRRKYFKKQ